MYFLNNVDARWLKDGRSMILLNDFVFVDSNGVRWEVPKDSVINGSSIPEKLWSVIGRSPFVGKHRKASVVHDQACKEKKHPYKIVHNMFYDAMICAGEDQEIANIMVSAVHIFGPKWDKFGNDLFAPDLDSKSLIEIEKRIKGS